MNPWEILAIAPTGDKKLIKRAYAKQLKNCNPEEDQNAFMVLRAAYERALVISNSISVEQENDSQSQVTDYENNRSDKVDNDINESTESGGMANLNSFLENYVDYNSLGSGERVASSELPRIDFDGEYDACVEQLNRILESDDRCGDVKAWQDLFGSQILINNTYRQYFAANLGHRLREYLELKKSNNALTPEIINILGGFVLRTHGIDKNYAFNDLLLVNISNLITHAHEYEERIKSRKTKYSAIRRTLRLFMWPKGRINRLTYVLATTALVVMSIIMLGVSEMAASGQQQKNEKPKVSVLNKDYKGPSKNQTIEEMTKQFMKENPDFVKQMTEHNLLLQSQNQKNKSASQVSPLYGIKKAVNRKSDTSAFALTLVYVWFWSLAMLTIKRLHDSASTISSALVLFIPFFGLLIFAFIIFKPSDETDNEYGPPPLSLSEHLRRFRDNVYRALALGEVIK